MAENIPSVGGGTVYKNKTCPNCGQIWIPPTGLSSIFRMPTGNEWTILIMLVGVLLMSYAYIHDTKECRNFFAEPSQVCGKCMDLYNILSNSSNGNITNPFVSNFSNLTLGQVKIDAQNKS